MGGSTSGGGGGWAAWPRGSSGGGGGGGGAGAACLCSPGAAPCCPIAPSSWPTALSRQRLCHSWLRLHLHRHHRCLSPGCRSPAGGLGLSWTAEGGCRRWTAGRVAKDGREGRSDLRGEDNNHGTSCMKLLGKLKKLKCNQPTDAHTTTPTTYPFELHRSGVVHRDCCCGGPEDSLGEKEKRGFLNSWGTLSERTRSKKNKN